VAPSAARRGSGRDAGRRRAMGRRRAARTESVVRGTVGRGSRRLAETRHARCDRPAHRSRSGARRHRRRSRARGQLSRLAHHSLAGWPSRQRRHHVGCRRSLPPGRERRDSRRSACAGDRRGAARPRRAARSDRRTQPPAVRQTRAARRRPGYRAPRGARRRVARALHAVGTRASPVDLGVARRLLRGLARRSPQATAAWPARGPR